MYEEYGSFYKQYYEKYGPKTAIFLMVGSFYELYDVLDKDTGETLYNIKEVTDFLGIQLTPKKDLPASYGSVDGKPPSKQGLFAGFPDYALHKHAARLTTAGWTVVVIDQVKDKAGKVIKRVPTRILSPSTHVEAMSASETPYLTALFFQLPAFGVATLDLTTGQTMTYSGTVQGHTDVWTADDLCQQLTLFQPKELHVFYMDSVQESHVRRLLTNQTIPIFMKPLKTLGSFTNHVANAEYLRRIYSIKSMLPPYEYLGLGTAFGVGTASAVPNPNPNTSLTALLLLLQIVEEHIPSALHSFQRNSPWIPNQNLLCGNHALQQLQMDAVVNLFSPCITSMGKRSLHHRLLRPLTQASMIDRRLTEVGTLMDADPDILKLMKTQFRFIGDLPRIHRKVLLATVTPQEFVILGQSYLAVETLLTKVSILEPPPYLLEQLNLYTTVFNEHIDLEKAIQASQDLTPYTDSRAITIERQIKTVLDSLEQHRLQISQTAGLSVDVLKLEEREKEPFGIRLSSSTLAVLKTLINKLPKGTTFQTLKSGGWMDTPALNTHNQQLIKLREQLVQTSRDIILSTCSSISDAGKSVWTDVEEWIAHLDCTFAIARTAKERGFTRPIVDMDKGDAYLNIEAIRHPLVENTGTRVPYVKHDVALGHDSRSWLVYGMNASGKSTLMKATGIAVLLAQAGSYVPAKAMTVRPFQAIYTRILNQDNLFAGLSSFAVEMSELRDILRAADQNTLILGDELCSGTESVSAMALVAAGIEWLSKKRSKFIFATHLHDLPTILKPETIGLKIWHLHVEYDPVTKTLVYDRTLMPGSGSTLYGLEVAKAMDLPTEFLESATALRHKLVGSVPQHLAKGSIWNAAVTRRTCEVCGSINTKDLEVHHIRPRADATDGILSDGTPMNHPSNLIVLCEACHDKEHGSESVVTELVQTSEGPKRTSTVTTASKQSKWSEEELATIHDILRQFKTASTKALSNRLSQNHSISISASTLASIKKGLH
jgi:DNA mismatch repair protein MutS